MATYEPPTENLAIFDPIVFLTGDEPLTYNIAVKKFLKYPNAQGLENLQAINVNGIATFNTNVNIGSAGTANLTPTLTTYKTDLVIGTGGNGKMDIECPVNIGGFGVLNMDTAPINLTSNSNIQQTGATTFNNLNGTNFTTANGASATATISVKDSVANKSVLVLPNAGAGSYNPATDAGNEVIMAKGSAINTETLELTTWSATNSAVKIAPTSVSMGAGGTSSTSSTYVLCNGTNVVVSPSLAFPDGRVQNSAFTGAGTLAGSYTLANLTIDSNGKITAISNGSSTSQFQPTFHNLANYQTGTSGYSQGAYINWSGGWGALDYAIIRYRVQVNWGNSGSGWLNYATSAGEIIIRPHFSPAGVLGSLGTPNQFWTTNSGSLFGATGKLLYSTGVSNNGSQGYFFIYGNGGSGGGASGYIQLMCDAPGASGGWEYTQTYEYMVRSTSGGSITFTNGAGGGTATTNNSLP